MEFPSPFTCQLILAFSFQKTSCLCRASSKIMSLLFINHKIISITSQFNLILNFTQIILNIIVIEWTFRETSLFHTFNLFFKSFNLIIKSKPRHPVTLNLSNLYRDCNACEWYFFWLKISPKNMVLSILPPTIIYFQRQNSKSCDIIIFNFI